MKLCINEASRPNNETKLLNLIVFLGYLRMAGSDMYGDQVEDSTVVYSSRSVLLTKNGTSEIYAVDVKGKLNENFADWYKPEGKDKIIGLIVMIVLS